MQRVPPGGDRAAYVTAARDVLQDRAPSLLRAGTVEWISVVATLAQYLAASGRPLPTTLLRELGIGVIAAQLVHDAAPTSAIFDECVAIYDQFVRAIRPRAVWRVAQKPEAYVERLRAFTQRWRVGDDDFRAEILERFRRQSKDGERRFLERVPLLRLRTYPDAMLHTVVQNFSNWDSILRFLERERDEAEEKLRSMLEITVRALRSRGVDHGRAEDGVFGALLYCIESLDDPWDGYVYESPFPAWLVATATNLARGHARHLTLPIPDEQPAAEAKHDPDALRAWRERRRFVLATFDGNDQDDAIYRRACAIVDALVAAADVEDKELAEVISRTTGATCNVNELRLTRMALRARLGVFRYLDSHSEQSMEEWCKARWGVREHDVPMLRKIEASARAADHDGTLAWALVAWAQFESDRFRGRWEPQARALMTRPWPDYETRLREWRASDRARSARSVRSRATAHRCGWAVPAAWHLRILRLQTPDEVGTVLRSRDAAWVAAEL